METEAARAPSVMCGMMMNQSIGTGLGLCDANQKLANIRELVR